MNTLSRIRGYYKRLTLGPNPNILVHVGKCGGSTLKKAAKRQQRYKSMKVVHIKKPPIHKGASYLLTIRNPISRALSAFNWRYKLVVEDETQKDRFQGEWAILTKYGTLDTLALSLYAKDGSANAEAQQDFLSIHHLGENIHFYLGELLQSVEPDQIRGVFSQEFLDSDIYDIFGLPSTERRKSNKKITEPSRLELSPQAVENMKRFLRNDYECIERLHEMEKISDYKYSVIMSYEDSP
ncbi:hypothetical protein QWY84_09620 [Aquisalimonas lutea]|uniref:hypothetical protein n=1 Tax=Aquisalimonas lutea TaxID=1327750 RepID=UPI0025B52587|nr:hypothetical protein [Aquisalimonas lutea]MDN3517869.1 hypothetical protein [Aquisalimonas lutea]